MFEYMDGIVDAVKELGQAAVDVAVFVLSLIHISLTEIEAAAYELIPSNCISEMENLEARR